MNNMDIAIEYNGKLQEVKDKIETVKSMSFDTTAFTKRVETIETNVQTNVEQNYNSFGNGGVATAFLSDSLIATYSEAIENLNDLSSALDEYQMYYQITQSYKNLQTVSANLDETNIDTYLTSLIALLDTLKASSTIDYRSEASIVENVYKLIYKSLKLEATLSTNSILIDRIKNDSTDTAYIVKLINEDLSKITDNIEIAKFLNNLNNYGLDNRELLNKELIALIAYQDDPRSFERIQERFSKASKKTSEIDETISRAEGRKSYLEDSRQEYLSSKKRYSKKALKKRILLFIQALVLVAQLGAANKIAKDGSIERSYETTVETYDTGTNSTTSETFYDPSQEGEVTITEYGPWTDTGLFREEEHKYSRDVYTYTPEVNENATSAEDYLNPEITGEVSYDYDIEYSDEQPSDYGYTGNKYVVSTTTKNLDVYEESENTGTRIALTALLSTLMLALNLGLSLLISNETLASLKRRIKDNKESSKELEEQIKAKELEIAELENQRQTAYMNFLTEYYNLPEFLRTPEIEEEKQKLTKTL